jgi:hypothetical protein
MYVFADRIAVCNRAIVVLESNTGYTQLHRMLVEAGDRSKVRTLPFAWLVAFEVCRPAPAGWGSCRRI